MASEISQKIHAAFSSYPKRSYPKGQILLFGDENPSHIFYLIKGKVIKYDLSYRGDEVIVNVFGKGSFFPMSWAMNRIPEPFFYKTEEASEIHLVPCDFAVQFIKDNPDVMYDLLARVYRGLNGLLGRVVQLMSGTAKSRVLYELLIEARRFGRPLPDTGVQLSLTEMEIAARAGLSRETVNREVQKMKREKLIDVVNGKLIVRDAQALELALAAAV